MHSKMFERIKFYYDTNRWGIDAVKTAVVKGLITANEYKEITGEDYE